MTEADCPAADLQANTRQVYTRQALNTYPRKCPWNAVFLYINIKPLRHGIAQTTALVTNGSLGKNIIDHKIFFVRGIECLYRK